jgi:hypothetical protein
MHVDELDDVLAVFNGNPHHVGRACKGDAINRFSVCVSDCHISALAKPWCNNPGLDTSSWRTSAVPEPAVITFDNSVTLLPAERDSAGTSTEIPALRAFACFHEGPPAGGFVPSGL